MSRIRERFDARTDRTFQELWRRTDGGQPPSGTGVFVAHEYLTPYRARITDEPKTRYVQYRKSPVVRRRAFKSVSHFKHSIYQSSAAGWHKLDSSPLEYYTGGAHVIHAIQKALTGDYVDAEALARNWIDSKIATCGPESYRHYERWQSVKPSMATRANLTVFLAELRDVKRMWDILPGKHFHANDWREVLKWANGQHLNWNFGWKPFLSDVKKTLKSVDSFETRLAKFITSADRELRRRYGDPEQEVSFDEVVTATTGSLWRYRRKGLIRFKRASAFDFSYLLPSYGQDELRVRAWLDSFGLKPSISNLWELIPFSFVVDWFYNVGGLLSAAESDWAQPSINLHQAMYSVDVNAEWSWSVLTPVAYGSHEMPGLTSSYSTYTRRLGLPVFSGVTENLDADKIRLGASLLLSRIL